MTWLRAEHQVAWIVAGCFAILSAAITSYQVYFHIKYNSFPALRRFVIRIILMVPIYAVGSWLGLRFASIALYFDLLRECYEAFVIYSFYQLLVTYLGGERKLVAKLAEKPSHPHVFPFCCLPAWRMHDRFHIQLTEEEMEGIRRDMKERSRREKEQRRQLRRASNGTHQAQTNEEDQGDQTVSVTSTYVSMVAAQQIAVLPASSSSSTSSNDVAVSASSAVVVSTTSSETTIAVTHASTSNDSASDNSQSLSVDVHAAPSTSSSSSAPAPADSPTSPVVVPTSYLSPFSRPHHSDFLTHTQLGTLQYCIAKPLTAFLAFVLSMLDLYGESSLDWKKGYPYLAFITNMSQIWAMYCLVLFYMVCKEDLAPLRPIPKFLCVKAVVFFTWWQSVLLVILAEMGVLHETKNFTKDEIVVALQDFIVCIEMLLAAIAHHVAFSWQHFYDASIHASQPRQPLFRALVEAIDVTDVYVSDVRHVTAKARKRKMRDNKLLTEEEMQEITYANFMEVSEQRRRTTSLSVEGGATMTAASNSLQDELNAPLNPLSSAERDFGESEAEFALGVDRTRDKAVDERDDLNGNGAASPSSTTNNTNEQTTRKGESDSAVSDAI